MKTIALHSIKGGVGKSTAAVNLAHLASLSGRRTLLIDLDPQGASTFCLQLNPTHKVEARDFMKKKGVKRIGRAFRETEFENLSMLPASEDFRLFDYQIDSTSTKPQKALSKVMDNVNGDYDLVFLDCPPSLTLLCESVFFAADMIVIPVVPVPLSVHTYLQEMQFLLKKGISQSKVMAYFSMTEAHRRSHHETMDELGDDHDNCFFKTAIPRRTTAEEMGERRAPLTKFARNSELCQAFENLWSEIQEKLTV